MTVYETDIRNEYVMKDLLAQGFELVHTSPGIWRMAAPQGLSTTKSKELVSICIKLYSTAKEISRAKQRYQKLVDRINKINEQR